MISYVRAESGITEVKIDDTYPYAVSGDNADGFIITEYRIHNASTKSASEWVIR